MATILGIDPGWSKKSDSAVALVTGEPGRWRTIRVAPNYAAFVGQAQPGATLDAVLAHAVRLAGARVDVAAVDMPLASGKVIQRRACDEEVSKRYGGRGCAVHSPTPNRPGPLADEYRSALAAAGLPLATTSVVTPCSIEVYPHVSLLRLMSASYRVPYKVGRARTYWKGRTPVERRALLLAEWRKILNSLERVLGTGLMLPSAPRAGEMKALEDQLDALVCAWTAIEYLGGRLEPLGDTHAAIWCPIDPA